jgi:hypothetical protein
MRNKSGILRNYQGITSKKLHLNQKKNYGYAKNVRRKYIRASHLLLSGMYVILQKYFSHPSLVIYFFGTPPMIFFFVRDCI